MNSYNIKELYESRGFQARLKTGQEFTGPCPFCGGTDRFQLFTTQGNDGAGRYWCRQCGASGDCIQFLRELDNLTYKQALDALGIAHDENRPRPRREIRPAPAAFEPAPAILPGKAWQDKARAVVEYAQGQLAKNPAARAWLERERGLQAETVRKAGLGWIPQNLYRPYPAFGLPAEYKDNGKPRMVWIPKGLCIPVFAGGNLARVKFRLADPGQGQPKYLPLKQPDAAKNTSPLFLPCPHHGAPFVIVESELDGLLLAQEAWHLANVVALGSAAMRPDKDTWAKILQAPLVLVSLDFDNAGNKAACTWWKDNLPNDTYRLWPVPEGKDPTDAYKAGWSLSDWIRAGIENEQ